MGFGGEIIRHDEETNDRFNELRQIAIRHALEAAMSIGTAF